YVKRQFAKCLTITEKRSLIYLLKSLVIRNRKGPVAGLYCWIESKCLTLFYEDNGKRVQKKIDINEIGNQDINQLLLKVVHFMNIDGEVEEKAKQLHQMLIIFKEAVNDLEFMPQLLDIDKWIETE
ncbi:unnamed protein product, partial [Medioppia subpectinata]